MSKYSTSVGTPFNTTFTGHTGVLYIHCYILVMIGGVCFSQFCWTAAASSQTGYCWWTPSSRSWYIMERYSYFILALYSGTHTATGMLVHFQIYSVMCLCICVLVYNHIHTSVFITVYFKTQVYTLHKVELHTHRDCLFINVHLFVNESMQV